MKEIGLYLIAIAAALLLACCVVNAELAKTKICNAMGGEYQKESQACLSEPRARRVR